MKYLFTFFLLIVCLPVFAQEEAPSYSEAVAVEGISRSELLSRAQRWLKNVDYKVEFSDPKSGFISVGGESKVRGVKDRKLKKGKLIYVITLIVEDGRYWYDFAQFFYEVTPANRKEAAQGNWVAGQSQSPEKAHLYQIIDDSVRAKIENLKRTMTAPGNGTDPGIYTLTGVR